MSNAYFAQPSVMTAQQHFSQIPAAEIPRSKFDRSHALKTTFDAGKLIPVFVDEVLPGDTFDLNATLFARLATPLKPVMDNIFIDTHFFFVPYRLVWDNFVNFMGERNNPTDDPTAYSVPQTVLDIKSITHDGLANYLGIPRRAGVGNVSVNALPFRAYNLIYNEWYRDENLQNSLTVPKGAGPDTAIFTATTACQPRGKRKDYFTSALPWPQKGNPVTIGLIGQAPVTGIAFQGSPALGNYLTVRETATSGSTSYPNGVLTTNAGIVVKGDSATASTVRPDIYANLAASGAQFSVNDLRTAFQIQRLLERDARGGTRYIELVLSHFGVHSPDGRLQRPEYLGGGTTSINFNPIANTSATATEPQGGLAAFATGVARSGFTKSFTEHGIIIGIASARADLTYQQGIERFWFRNTRYDFYWPALAHLGEQAILNREIFVQGTSADTNVFGYQERYAEYRYKPSRITGKFNSGMTSSLDYWHLSQNFGALPVLNSSFIVESPPMARISAVPSEPSFLLDAWFDLKCDRPMPVYSVPGLIDHF